MKQMTLAVQADQSAGFEKYRKPTRRDAFLAEMQTLVPWSALCAVIEPHYPKRGNGRPPIGLERMLRIHLLQHWFNLPDLACEEALYDSAALRAFVGIDLGREPVPDATTILKFRHLLEKHRLGEAIFAEVGSILQSRGLRLSAGTIVDATIISAPSSTKNVEQQRDPEMRQTKKGNQWHFGMKVHIGADSKTGLVHRVVVTGANVHDKHPLPDLLHGAEKRVYGDRGYQGCTAIIKAAAPEARDFTNRRVRFAGYVNEVERLKNRTKSRTRARVEHPFLVLKRLWGFAKVRYRGLVKNANRTFTAMAMVNLFLAARRTPGLVRP
jgi:IS5 family transposase